MKQSNIVLFWCQAKSALDESFDKFCCKYLFYKSWYYQWLMSKKVLQISSIFTISSFLSYHIFYKISLREKCPDTELFLDRIFKHSDWMWRFTELTINSVFGHFLRSTRSTSLKWRFIAASSLPPISKIFDPQPNAQLLYL